MLKEQIDIENIPQHVAIIMDGNGRWAQERGLMRAEGHKAGVRSVREVAEASAELGVKFLTLYAFSTENWNRPQEEINALMELLVETIQLEVSTLNENNIQLMAIGNLNNLPPKCQTNLQSAIQETSQNTGLVLNIALSYSSRWEITSAVQQISQQIVDGVINMDEITENLVSNNLQTNQMPDPELLIRTSGEERISNFLLWQLAYSELYFTTTLWPDFGKDNYYEAIIDYQARERRFGKTSEQIKNEYE